LNYFSYFSEIEDTFIRRRGKHLMLSPIDWALIESWKERGVPLHVAVRGIEHSFDSYDAKKHKRTVKTLLYCQEEVEAQYAEWLESRVGSRDADTDEEVSPDKTPFSRDVVLSHLARSLESFAELATGAQHEDLKEALQRATSLLVEVRQEYESATRPDTRKLEESLTGIDRLLDDAIFRAIGDDQVAAITAEVEAQLKPYKRHMDKPAFEQTRANLLRKRLREHFDVPRLSLFYL
jgi:phage terminase Nu1 subunit (DNA packaging protein)